MHRILVIGSGGAGKTMLAARVGARLGLPVVHLDALYWHPGWVPTPDEEWTRRVREIAAGERWVMDGNYGGTMAPRIEAADTIVFLDPPRLVCVARVVRRWWRHRGRSRPEMAAGCPERITLEFLRWIWSYPRRRRPAILQRLASAAAAGKNVVVLRSAAEVERFVDGLTPDHPAPGAR